MQVLIYTKTKTKVIKYKVLVQVEEQDEQEMKPNFSSHISFTSSHRLPRYALTLFM